MCATRMRRRIVLAKGQDLVALRISEIAEAQRHPDLRGRGARPLHVQTSFGR